MERSLNLVPQQLNESFLSQGEKYMSQAMKQLVPFLSLVVLLCASASALAQAKASDDYPRFEVFAGYSALGANDIIIFGNNQPAGGGYASTAGFETSLTRNFTRHLGVKADFSAHFKSTSGPLSICNPTCTTPQERELKTRVYNFLAGPEFKARNHTRFTPFVYALGGLAHTRAQFTTPGPTFNLLLKQHHNSFAMALGGGLDLRVSKRISIRGSMDYNPVFISNSAGGRQDFARFSLGLLFH
jgi:opacity protein-like surface antigen